MKRLLPVVLLLVLNITAFGQAEQEPNNSFTSANTVEYDINLTTAASLGNGDAEDHFKLPFEYDGNMYVYVTATNTGSDAHVLELTVYNGLDFGAGNGGLDPQEIGYLLAAGRDILPGETVTDSVLVCGLAADNYYLRFNTTGDFDYNFRWFPVNTATNEGWSNDSFAAATDFFFNVQASGGLRFEHWGNTDRDSVDYWKTTLPAGDYNNIRLNLKAGYNGCHIPGRIKYQCFKNSSTVPFAEGYIGNDTALAVFQQVNSSVSLSNMQQGDVLYVKFSANAAFSYSLRYRDVTTFDDEEPNNEIWEAPLITEGSAQYGTVGEYDYNNNVFTDQFDLYKIELPNDGAINISATATNLECYDYYYSLSADILDHWGNELISRQLISWEDYPACNDTKSDVVKFRALSAGTYYIRIRNDYGGFGKMTYSFHYTRTDSTGNVDQEPNGTLATALPAAPNELKKGHLLFRKDATTYDYRDYFKSTLAADGNLTVYLKSINRYDDYVSAPVALYINGYPGRRTNTVPFDQLNADEEITDTLQFCGMAAGDLVFELYSQSLPFEYQFQYKVADTSSAGNDAEPNNSFEEARLIGAAVTKKGHINFKMPEDADTYDYYKMVYSGPDSLVLFIKSVNAGCFENQSITYYGYNKNHNLVFSKNRNNIAAGAAVYDTIRYKVNSADTMYLRFTASGPFQYEFTTNLRLPTSVFKVEGDSTVCHSTQIYKAVNIADEPVTYNWSLPLGGGTITAVDSIATVVWNADGNRSVQLILSNPKGNSPAKTRTVIVNGLPPTQVPVAYNFARTLSTSDLPPGTGCQWYNGNTLIPGAVYSSYYAATAGSYTVKFVSDCGEGPASNAISFAADALPQVISFPNSPTVTMSPSAKVIFTATSNSGLPVFYEKVSGSGTIQNDTLYITGNNTPGQIIVKAVQPGDDVYLPAPDQFDTITVIKGNQTITFDPIPAQVFSTEYLTLSATSSMQLGIGFSVVSGNAYILTSSGFPTNILRLTGAGPVTVRASQNGNANYNPAAPVERTFCVGVRSLAPITGDANPCLASYRYVTQKMEGANYVWSLSSGGILTMHNDTAWVQWQTPGTHTIKVKANSACDAVFSTEQSLSISTSSNNPVQVSNMLPLNNAQEQQLPLNLSWIPGANTVSYDLYVWDSAAVQPAVPYRSNITDLNYTLPYASFAYNKSYKWRIVSKNPCTQTPGPVQVFRLIPLPDLAVTDVQIPNTANSGQTITISWTVSNLGPGKTLANQRWTDAVYLSFDSIPTFNAPPEISPIAWSNSNFPIRPLLVGTKTNVSALDSGQHYTNSINFTLPLNYSQPLYGFVITGAEPGYAANYPPGTFGPIQVTRANDTAFDHTPIIVSLTPAPDLRVDTVFAPFTTFSGSTINLTYKVKNYGALTGAGVAWTDSVFISRNPLFDRNNAFPLYIPKANNSYYPNQVFAAGAGNGQLQHDSAYTRTLQVVVPNFIFGQWYVFVKANAKETLYEGTNAENNLGQSLMQVYLTPTPKLTVNALTVPYTSVSTTQPVGINWNIFNEGFRDNIERNRGHFITIGYCGYPCGYLQVCYVPYIEKDSVTFGSSYWTDRVYLSRDSSGLDVNNALLINETEHGTKNSGLYSDQLSHQVSSNCYQYGGLERLNTDNIIDPGSNFPKSLGFNIPDSLAPGDYYIYVYANPAKTVFEYPGTPQIKRSALPLTVVRPDVTVPQVTAPVAVTGGQTFTVNYTVANNGPGAVFNHVRRDKIYVSSFSSFDGSAQLIDTKIYTEDLPLGTVPHSFSYSFPAAASGARYFYVHTNYDSAFKENNYNNNISVAAATVVTAALPSDLIVTSVLLPDTMFTIYKNVITYTVKNNGANATAGVRTDSVYFSCNSVFSGTTNNFAGKKVQPGILAPGESFTDTIHITIPKWSYDVNSCFPQTANTTAYFFVKTNATNAVYEGTNVNNNVSSLSKTLTNPFTDLIVTKVVAPDTVTTGRNAQLTWVVKNIGYNPGNLLNGAQSGYADAVYFSADAVLDANDVRANSLVKSTPVNRFDSVTENRQIIVPNLFTGDYYVIAKTNYTNSIAGEIAIGNNSNLVRDDNGLPKKIHVIQPLLPDLGDSLVFSQASVAVGQYVSAAGIVANKGAGVTYPAVWYDQLLLGTDLVSGTGDRLLAQLTHNGALAPGGSYRDSLHALVPLNTVPGNYILKRKVNPGQTVFETDYTNNNSYIQLNVYSPPAVDLTVSNITHPDTVYLGYTMDTAKWVVTNQSPNEAKGISSDGVYLSKTATADASSVLIGTKSKVLNMLPLSTDSVKLAPLVMNVPEGNYNLVVKTDLLSNIVETNKDNNTGVAAMPVYVKVKPLQFNIVTPDSLGTRDRFYKLVIPDSLRGSTIRISLQTPDSLSRKNELFVAAGYVPSPAQFDYKFENPDAGNQQLIISSVTDSLYYIDVHCANPAGTILQHITLYAEKLPFAVLNVDAASGGNIGNVTVKLSGSLFAQGMRATLTKAGTTILSSAVYFTNSRVVYATFNLQGKPMGVYDVSLIKGDTATAVKAASFSVVAANNGGLITGSGANTGAGNGDEPGCDPGAPSGLNSQLTVEMVAPERALINWPFIIQINYRNPTNYDVPAQIRTLYSEAHMKMALTKAGLENGSTALTLHLTEEGGPPGIIRAGGSGTITVHVKSPSKLPENPLVFFNLQ